jgi:membrane protein implicated in regulation of membrane protease activity
MTALFANEWMWLIFVIVGVVLGIIEVVAGGEADIGLIGLAFIVGGLVTMAAQTWSPTVVVTTVICVAYVTVGRRYVKRWMAVRKMPTNVDALIGRRGLVLQDISRHDAGRVQIESRQWRARAEGSVDIDAGKEVEVTAIRGATLEVREIEGGD